jgi:hypothetical protein
MVFSFLNICIDTNNSLLSLPKENMFLDGYFSNGTTMSIIYIIKSEDN